MARSSPRFAQFLAIAFGLVVVYALWDRFHYGTDLSDEAFSIALPYRFARGDVPFVDEVSTAQTAGILLLPFVWLWVKVTGGSSGIVLFCRGVHLLFKGIAAYAVFTASKRWLSRSAAICVAFLPFGFVPHSIPNVGYNVLGMTLLVAGTFASAAALTDDEPPLRLLGASGLAYGLAAFAYPPTAPAALVAGVLVLGLAKTRRLHAFMWFVGGGAVAFALVVPFLLPAGPRGVRASFAFGSGLWPRPTSKFVAILNEWWTTAPDLILGGSAALVVVGVLRRNALIAIVVPAVVVTIALWFRGEATTHRSAFHMVTYGAFLAPAMLLACKPDRRLVRGALAVILPSFLGGWMTAYGSANYNENGPLGLYAAFVLFGVLSAVALERAYSERIWAMAPAMLLSLTLVTRVRDYVYRDAPLEQLTTKVTSGPFRGLYTTSAHATLFRELELTFKRQDRTGGSLLVLYETPGIHLFSRMPASGNTVWPLSYYGQPELLDHWKHRVNGRGLVVRVHGYGRGVLVDPLVEAPERLVERGSTYSVYSEPAAAP